MALAGVTRLHYQSQCSHSSEDLVGIESSGLRAELLLSEVLEAAVEAVEVWRLELGWGMLWHYTLHTTH